jgi:hypothetical protein
MRNLTLNPIFDETFIKQLALALSAELAQKAKSSPRHWPELMNIETAALYLDRSPDAIRHLIEAKLLPSCRLDRRVQIRRVDLDRLMERHTG